MIIAIIQARTSSTRLPNKVLKTIVGKPMLQLQIERVKQSKLIEKVIVATSINSEDNAIEKLCQQLNTSCFRGELNDVLARYYYCAIQEKAEHIVRLTGDCPLIDAAIIDQVIRLHLDNKSDYTSNCRIPRLPDGLDVEIFTLSALKQSFQQAKKPSEREHVTLFMRNHAELFKQSDFQYNQDLSHYRWTVDEPEDFEFISEVYQYLYPKKTNFTIQDILLLLKHHPELTKMNQKFIRNEGLLKSLTNDKEQGFD